MFNLKKFINKKKDKYYLQIYEKSIKSLYSISMNHINLMIKRPPSTQEQSLFLERLTITAGIFQKNKFSSPIDSYNIGEAIICIRGYADEYIKTFNLLLDPETSNEESIDNINELLRLTKGITDGLNKIRHITRRESIKIDLGFDIIQEYYYRKKIKIKKKNVLDDMTIRFIKPEKVDIDIYKKKEVIKDEQHQS